MVRLSLRSGAKTLARSHAARLSVCLLLFAATMTGCARNPVSGSRELVFMSERQEIETGREADAIIRTEMGVYDDPVLQQYVEEVAQAIAGVSHRPELPWTFTVVDSPVVNAFALPGGFIYLTRGLMAYLNDEAELAGVLGHEIGHVTARHAVQAYSRAAGAQVGMILGQIFVPGMRPQYGRPDMTGAAAQGLGVLFLKFGRDDERQADRLGAEYASGSGWHPRGVAGMLTTLGRIADTTDRHGTPNWLATHPEPLDRVAGVAATVDSLLAETPDPATLRIAREDYLRRIDGLIFGDNPDQGIVRGSEFLHPEMRFALTFPVGWEVQNSPEVVVAREPGQDRYMLLQLADDNGRGLPEIADSEMTAAGFRQVQGGRTDINGLDAYLGTWTQNVRGMGETVARVACLRSGGLIYLFGAFVPVSDFDRVEREIHASIRSFRELTVAEADAIRPNRIAIHTVRDGETWQSIAQRVGAEIVTAPTLAIMNGFPVNEQPLPGDVIKIVTPG